MRLKSTKALIVLGSVMGLTYGYIATSDYLDEILEELREDREPKKLYKWMTQNGYVWNPDSCEWGKIEGWTIAL